MKLKRSLIGRIIAAGLPSFTNQISGSILSLVLNKNLGIYGGDVAIGGIGAINSLQQLLVMPTIGISHGAQPIIGYNRGAGNYRRIKETLGKAILTATIISVLGFLAIRLFPETLIGFFGKRKNSVTLVLWPSASGCLCYRY